MHWIVCLDERDGMAFNHRRQSSDRLLRRRLLDLVGEGRLWMNGYSAGQFSGEDAAILVDEDFLRKADDGDCCFIEQGDIASYADRVTRVTVYRWNRVYPADTHFPWDLFPHRCLRSTTQFVGYSHACITEEVYDV